MNVFSFNVRRDWWSGLLLAVLLALPVQAGAASDADREDDGEISVAEPALGGGPALAVGFRGPPRGYGQTHPLCALPRGI